MLGIAACWVTAGSSGLLGHPLRHALTLFLLAATVIVGVPAGLGAWPGRRKIGFFAILLAGGLLQTWSAIAINVAGCAVVLAALAWVHGGQRRETFLVASVAVLIFAFYRFGLDSLPWFWLATDKLGTLLSRLVGFIVRSPLYTGATFAGLDFLVLTGALYLFWVFRQSDRSAKLLLRPAVAILLCHFVYLGVLAWSPALLKLLPAARTTADFGVTPPFDWAGAVRSLIPWNLPTLALLFHAALAAYILKKLPVPELADPRRPGRTVLASNRANLWRAATIILAACVPVVTSLNTKPLSLRGKKIVLFEKGFLNWMKPKHGEYGRLSVGMYGMMTNFLQSYGANCFVSPELSETDLQGADVVALIFPNKPWAPGQLERISNFVRNGGSLLVLGEHTVVEKEGGNRFNDALQPTAMRVAFDSATFEIGGWLESYQALAHPAQAGLTDERNQFGVVIGASVEARWPARPMLIGRWGFSDPGDASNDESKGGSMMGNHKYDPGEKLGDLIVASEQKVGKGRVVAFGDTSGFSNSILFGSHDYVSRLFAYMADPPSFEMARLWLGLILFLILLAVTWMVSSPLVMATVAAAFSVSIALCTVVTHDRANVLPDGRGQTPNKLAYVDQSHLERHSSESWRPNGVGGLQMTLMRDDSQVLGMHHFDAERLQRAGLFVSVAPSRRFTASEIRAVRTFLENGGIFICTVGYPESNPSRDMLAEFGFYIGGAGAAEGTGPEPKPYGHFKAPYFNGGDYMAYVRFHAAWTVESFDPQAQPLAYGPRDPRTPAGQPDPTVILMRRIGQGKMVVVADSDFCTNLNLEREGGEPFEGMRENADFWRWLISYLNDQPAWRPPKPAPAKPAATETSP